MRSHLRVFFSFGLLSFGLGTMALPAHAQYPGFDDPGAAVGNVGGSGGLTPSESNIDGGAIPLGATAQVVVLFRNDGAQPVETGLIRLYPSSTVSAVVSMNQCQDEPLSSGAECAVALSVKGLQPGQWRVEMLMSHNGRTRLVTATVSGTVEATEGASDSTTSDIDTIPSELDFETLTESQTLVEPIVLRNITSNPIEIKDIYIDSFERSGYSLKTECETLEAGQACIATVSWSPKLKGRSSGVLVIEHNGPSGLSSVPLKGEYTPEDVDEASTFPQAVPGKGLLVSSLQEIDFGEDIETTSTITVSLVNSGDSPLEINDILVSGSDNGVSFKDNGCHAGDVLQPIEACPLTISWSPTRVGELLDDIQVKHDGARGVLVLPVRGESIATVSQDQKAIMLSNSDGMVYYDEQGEMLDAPQAMSGDQNPTLTGDQRSVPARPRSAIQNRSTISAASAASVLDGYKITSFSPSRAIINGPGGSRIVFNQEETVIGGVPWNINIEYDGIEFGYQGQRILLLFDRSLSSINRVTASSDSTSDTTSSDE